MMRRGRGVDWLRRLYLRIGIHAAPPGTLCYFLHSRARALARWRLRRYVTGDVYARAAFGGTPYYDIAMVRRTRQVDGLALVFFMGLGDYLFATPVIEALRLAHPGLLIYAYASTSNDAVNSSLIEPMLRANRYVDAVFAYRGRPRGGWLDYDFRDCLKNVPRNFIILPVIYDTDPVVCHRVTAILESFNLPVSLPVPLPLVEPGEPSAACSELLAEIRRRVSRHSPRAIVCCHFGTRSSNYLYPHRDELLRGLTRAGYVVVTLSETDVADPRLVEVDISAITPGDTIGLLRALKAEGQALFIVSVNSVMWPISAALGIANLGLHLFHDPSVHQYHYPNIFVVTRFTYPRLSPSRMFIAPSGSYRETPSETGVVFTDFDARFVLECFSSLYDLCQETPQLACAAVQHPR